MTSSDWFAVSQLHSNHHIAESEGDAGVQAFNAGLDIETPNASGFAALAEAVQAGKVSEARRGCRPCPRPQARR